MFTDDSIGLSDKIIDWRKVQDEYYSFDDEVRLNPQAGSQWDGLRHFGHTETGLYYNNIHHDELLSTNRIGVDRKQAPSKCPEETDY